MNSDELNDMLRKDNLAKLIRDTFNSEGKNINMEELTRRNMLLLENNDDNMDGQYFMLHSFKNLCDCLVKTRQDS